MNNSIIYLICVLFSLNSLGSYAQSSSIELTQLLLKNETIESNLSQINNFFGNKRKGVNFPICKMLFTKTDNGQLFFTVEGIENSWNNLFRYDQVSYGFVVVDGRMFVVMGLKNEELDLNGLFYGSYTQRRFDRQQKPSTWNKKIPIWYYEQNLSDSDQFNLVLNENLDLLD